MATRHLSDGVVRPRANAGSEARRRLPGTAPRAGEMWIWDVADDLCPDTVQILDLFHVLQETYAVCKDCCDFPRSEFQRLRAWVKRGGWTQSLRKCVRWGRPRRTLHREQPTAYGLLSLLTRGADALRVYDK